MSRFTVTVKVGLILKHSIQAPYNHRFLHVHILEIAKNDVQNKKKHD